MSKIVLGLDIGGANLKAASSAGRAVSLPFPLWKQPDKLAASLAELIAQFPEANELAVTMTGELCDCFATKREGVQFILNALPTDKPAQVWSTAGRFVSVLEAIAEPIKVASANWHASATFCGRFMPKGEAIFLDIGSTTADIIPLLEGAPKSIGFTDFERLKTSELVYTGVKRTPVCAVMPEKTCAEFFAEMRDVNIVLGLMPESPGETDTADGRPATEKMCLARLARMFGGDTETLAEDFLLEQAERIHFKQVQQLTAGIREVCRGRDLPMMIIGGIGEWLAQRVLTGLHAKSILSLAGVFGSALSGCVAAYAVAILAAEKRV
jgi:probable H4MPT-linked C1 transfer pathway protein